MNQMIIEALIQLVVFASTIMMVYFAAVIFHKKYKTPDELDDVFTAKILSEAAAANWIGDHIKSDTVNKKTVESEPEFIEDMVIDYPEESQEAKLDWANKAADARRPALKPEDYPHGVDPSYITSRNRILARHKIRGGKQ